MKQRRPFRVVITESDKDNLRELERVNKEPYGIFFDSSGKVHIERINPGATYNYIWRTDQAAIGQMRGGGL